jgi:hypothetical protein
LTCFLASGAGAQTREHAETSIVLRLPAPPALAFPLFGPVREAEWSPQWSPRILHPADKGQVAGSVFTTTQHDQEVVWVLATYDAAALRVGYITVWPGMCATQLDIALKAIGDNETEATVTYRQTALSEAGDEYVKRFASHFPSQRDHWQQAISNRLQELRKQ